MDFSSIEPVIKTTDITPRAILLVVLAMIKAKCTCVKAFEYMIQNNNLPCNVKFMIEGEEEVGSVNLKTFVENNTEKLKNDVILISDTGMISTNPSLRSSWIKLCRVE
jgi:hypothetical protein